MAGDGIILRGVKGDEQVKGWFGQKLFIVSSSLDKLLVDEIEI